MSIGSRLVNVVDPATMTVTTHPPLLAPRRLSLVAPLDGEDVVRGFTVPIATLFES